MTRRKLLFALVVFAAAMTVSFCVISRPSASAQPPAPGTGPGPKWEYLVSAWDDRDSDPGKKSLSTILNEHGAQGWELVNIIPYNGVGTRTAGSLYFKRPLQTPPLLDDHAGAANRDAPDSPDVPPQALDVERIEQMSKAQLQDALSKVSKARLNHDLHNDIQVRLKQEQELLMKYLRIASEK